MSVPPTIPSAWAGAHISPYLCRCHIHLHNHPHPCRSRRRVPVRTWRRASRTRCGSSALPVPRRRAGSIRSLPAPCACSAASSRTARGCIYPGSWRRIYPRDPTRQRLRAPPAATPGSRTNAWLEVLTNTTLDAVLGSSALGRSCPLLTEWSSSGCMLSALNKFVLHIVCPRQFPQSGVVVYLPASPFPVLEIRRGSGIRAVLPCRNWCHHWSLELFVWRFFKMILVTSTARERAWRDVLVASSVNKNVFFRDLVYSKQFAQKLLEDFTNNYKEKAGNTSSIICCIMCVIHY